MEQPQYAPPPAYGQPPPPEKKSNTTLIIIIVVVLLLCCCCVLVGALAVPTLLGPDVQNVFDNIMRELEVTPTSGLLSFMV